jgi:hypothetical protein
MSYIIIGHVDHADDIWDAIHRMNIENHVEVALIEDMSVIGLQKNAVSIDKTIIQVPIVKVHPHKVMQATAIASKAIERSTPIPDKYKPRHKHNNLRGWKR